jgi:SAM-dependent methyltransferase
MVASIRDKKSFHNLAKGRDKLSTGAFTVTWFLGKIKSAVKRVTPAPLRRYFGEYRSRRWNAKYEGRPVEEIFSAIYRERRWERQSGDDFSSGTGSRAASLVSPYVESVAAFLRSLPNPPSVVDLGCGDFNVGAQLRPYCGRYVACDVVPELIQRDKERFASEQVDFRCLDIIEDELPDGDVVFLRQVLQHLNNSHIAKVVPKLYRYKFLVLAEHIPSASGFPPNRDKPTGGGVRLAQGSGVVVTAPPFSLKVKSESILCSTAAEPVESHPGVVQTVLYELRAN